MIINKNKKLSSKILTFSIPPYASIYLFNPSLSSHAADKFNNVCNKGPKILDTWVYLSINTKVFGTLLSPKCMTELPTHPPRDFCVLEEKKGKK